MLGWFGILLFIIGVSLLLLDVDSLMWVFLFMIAGLVFMLLQAFTDDSTNRDDCESIGGEYIVVDEQWTGKFYMDVYGCVKK